jgi:antitoxin FitA
MLAGRHSRRLALPTLVIRNSDDGLHARLKAHAAAHGRSMEEEVRRILRERLGQAPVSEAANWVDAIRALVEPLGGIDLPDIDRDKLRGPMDFSGSDWDSES